MIFLNYSYLLTFLQTIVIGAGGLATAILAMWGLWTKILKASNGSNYIRYFDGTNDINTLIP